MSPTLLPAAADTSAPTPGPQALWDGDPAVRDWTDSQWDAVLSDPSATAHWHHLGQMAEALQAADRGQHIAPVPAADALAFARGVLAAVHQTESAPQASAPLAPDASPPPEVAPVRLPSRPVRPARGGAAGVAANDPVFGWRLVAGFSALVAVAALGWSNWSSLNANPHPALRAQAPAASAPAPEAVLVATPQGVVERDARLEALMRTHRQAGGGAGLQAPAGFLRAATHDAPER
jgi:hypothetical protein